jgi:AmmeMemoRadiSam system protein B
MHTGSIRQPAVAGMFYPGDAEALASAVDALLAGGIDGTGLSPARALVVPHAGYTYSGAIAAAGFRRLRPFASALQRAFIVGPSHVEAFDFTSVFDGEFYRTPLGDVAVDDRAARALALAHPSIKRDRAGHVLRSRERGEHAIEVELPFLQRLGDARVVPIIMGTQSWDACEVLGTALRDVVDWNHDIVIASSDLSHFYDDKRARELDGVFCETVATANAEMLYARLAGGECEACGGGPVVAALLACEGLRTRTCDVIARGNSGDVSHDRSSVVGYASAVITGDPA